MTTLFCEDFGLTGTPSCCTSCHEDSEDGYDELSELRKGEEIALVCCTVSQYLQKEGWNF